MWLRRSKARWQLGAHGASVLAGAAAAAAMFATAHAAWAAAVLVLGLVSAAQFRGFLRCERCRRPALGWWYRNARVSGFARSLDGLGGCPSCGYDRDRDGPREAELPASR